MNAGLELLVERIITINHAWKMAREEFGNDFMATKSLRHTKSSLQATLLRDYPDNAYLLFATDNELQGEEQYSVRLTTPICINGIERVDAEHLPIRIANELFTEKEISKLLK